MSKEQRNLSMRMSFYALRECYLKKVKSLRGESGLPTSEKHKRRWHRVKRRRIQIKDVLSCRYSEATFILSFKAIEHRRNQDIALKNKIRAILRFKERYGYNGSRHELNKTGLVINQKKFIADERK